MGESLVELVEVPAVLLNSSTGPAPGNCARSCSLNTDDRQTSTGFPATGYPGEPGRSPAFEPGFPTPYSFCAGHWHHLPSCNGRLPQDRVPLC